MFTFDLLTAESIDPPWDIVWDVANSLTVELKFTAKPFARGVELSGTTDSFASNTIADYTVTGGGSSISGGKITVSSTSTKTWLHQARKFIDGTFTLKLTTGVTVTTWTHQIIAKAVDASNYLAWQMTNTGTISFVKVVAGSATSLGATATSNLSISTSYWFRFVTNGNVLTGELWTTDPTLGGSPTVSFGMTLTGGDITTYGEGVSGYAGFRLGPGDTGWTYDDFSALWRVREKTLPVLTLTIPGADGDAPALGRLVLTDASGNDQGWAVWGLQSQNYDPASTAALFYEAESRTPMGTAALATVTDASGITNNVIREAGLTTLWSAILSTRASGGGAHLTHIGSYRIMARLNRPPTTGDVSVALEWAIGDFRSFERNSAVAFPSGAFQASFTVVDLGVVDLPPAATGSAQWEGRIIARSTVAGDDLSVDCLWLVPTDGSGELAGVVSFSAPTSYSAHDEFFQTAGALTGKTLPVGGTWGGAGDTDDFAVAANGAARRTAVSDASAGLHSGRFVTASTPVLSNVVLQTDLMTNAVVGISQGLVARFVDISNFLVVSAYLSTTGALIDIQQRVAGAYNEVGFAAVATGTAANTWYTLRATVNAAGEVAVWFAPAGGFLGDPVAVGTSSALATGGALDDGKVGLWDWYTGAGAVTRSYANFAAWVPTADAAIFASRSAEVRSDSTVRQDSAGTLWTPVSSYAGDRLQVPVAGPEKRPVRFVSKTSRGGLGDAKIDAQAAQLLVTPRYYVIP